MHSGWWGLSRDKRERKSRETQERKSVCYIYDIIIFPVGFSFVLSPFQYHNALQKAQTQYRLLRIISRLLSVPPVIIIQSEF